MSYEFFRFEIAHQLRQPLCWATAFVFALMTFGAVVTDAVRIGGAVGNVQRNSPYVILQFMTVMSVIAIFVVTAFVASAALRDFDRRTHELFFSKPIRPRDYLLGRFAGAWLIACGVLAACALGILVGSFMPWLEPARVGPFRAGPYLYALGVIVAPNLFFASAVFFTLAVLTRSWLGTYIGVVLFFAAYFLAATLAGDVERDVVASLIDPFGGAAFDVATRYWTVSERNTMLPPVVGPLLWNRLLWLAIGASVLSVGVVAFRTDTRRAGWWRGRRAAVETPELPGRPVARTREVPASRREFTRRGRLTQLLRAIRLEMRSVVTSVPFVVILAFGIFNLLASISAREERSGTPVYPVTRLMLENLEGSFLFLLVIITTFYAGELVWRERALDVDEVNDALPVPSWLPLVSKLTALLAVVFVFLAAGILASIGYQLWNGYSHIEPALYLQGLGIYGWPFVLMAVLAVFLQVLSNNKFVGYLLMIFFLIGNTVLGALHFDHRLYRYAGAPPSDYSDMNGFGHMLAPMLWFYAYWTAFAIALAGAAAVLWVRGRDARWRSRWREARERFRGPERWTVIFALTVFVLLGGWIFYNTNVLNEYVPGDEAERRQAEYEKRYARYRDIPMPRIVDVDTEVDIYPRERRVAVRGRYRLVNRTNAAIDTVHLTLDPRVEVRRLSLPESARTHHDPQVGYSIYALRPALPPGGTLDLEFDLALAHRGFVTGESNTSFLWNGTFFDNQEVMPTLGYDSSRQLVDPNARRKHGLEPVKRMPPLHDTFARRNTYLTADSDWIGFRTTVSTSDDQIALAPGYLVRSWTENGRRYFRYEMDSPILHYYSYLSARWEVRRSRWRDVAIEVYYHPAHAFNVDRMIDAVKKSLDYFTANFGPYQHRQVRILEFPRYRNFAQSFPNTIPYSENLGFIADLRDPSNVDYVFYVTAHEVAHQWWAHQVIGGNVQGATMLSESLAQYSALMVMEREYGRDQMRRFLKYELDGYLRGRGGELIEELPLMRVENQPYIHYNKGSLVFYALREALGEQALNAALARFVAAKKFQQPPFTYTPELLEEIRAITPPEKAGLLTDLFETITLFDNRAVEASARRLDDGRYEVKLTVDARKLRASGQGEEREVPIDDEIEVGVLAAPGEHGRERPLHVERRRIRQPRTEITLIVDGEPVEAGIDPFNRLVDRNSGDNRRSVALQ